MRPHSHPATAAAASAAPRALQVFAFHKQWVVDVTDIVAFLKSQVSATWHCPRPPADPATNCISGGRDSLLVVSPPLPSQAHPSRLPYPFVACVFRQDAETPHVVEVQGKGHSYELHIPEHFDEACSIMEACRLQACASGNSGRESEAAVVGVPPSLAAAAQTETHPYGTAGEDGGAAAGGPVGLAGAAAGGPR